ncbi:MAG: MaoC family dehydratase N-terminal domain-containing protein [Chloroflexi bacterium]|nr:MaoC family dehydratase N-terminal domain-containing protein [Chloroflexota bacterium]
MPAITEKERALIGKESAPRPAPYPVNEVMARFWCEMVEDANAIYFDDGCARGTWLQGKFAPPAMLFTWAMEPVWPEVEREDPLAQLRLEGCTATIAVNAVQVYLEPLRYGDTLTVTVQISEIGEEKTTRLGTGHFVSTLHTFRNQSGQAVGTHTFTLFMYRPHPPGGD